ncbi:MAG: assimilatory sulfite reductase (NADPH) flavoprotein subunit [Paludibacter sp.]|nr:assimilatory sulfite reductase (NADPH) flavoprotein subunit [Paludibacter sp.]
MYKPFDEEQFNQFTRLVNSQDIKGLTWISGYIEGLSQSKSTAIAAEPTTENITPESTKAASQQLTILYGSRTGNGAALAKLAERMATDAGINATVRNMETYPPRSILKEKRVLVIVSTHGEGDPPFQAKAMYDYLHAKRAPELNELEYAVLALGDSSYYHFCKTGKDVDTRLNELGAKRLKEINCSDVDLKASDEQWLKELLNSLKQPSDGSTTLPLNESASISPATVLQPYSKKYPYNAGVLEKINLHGRGSERTTLHIELQADGLKYEPGDSVGILPVNSTTLVNEALSTTGLDGATEVELQGKRIPLKEALLNQLEIGKLNPDVLKKYVQLFPDSKAATHLTDSKTLQEYLYGRDLVDLLSAYPEKLTAQQLVDLLKPLQPRYYSIASSPLAYPGELHLTVALVEYQSNRRTKNGTCTGFLSEVLLENDTVPVFIESNPNFRLPANPSTSIIMIGAGTGIAPFRAFIQERELTPEAGKSWLFFGNRHFETEFLYQTEWQHYLKSGVLTRMDVAFSRDSDQPVYVQHRLLENGKELYDWISEGAHVYICGDMRKMAADVQLALSELLQQYGGLDPEQAQQELDQMQRERRLQLDVY